MLSVVTHCKCLPVNSADTIMMHTACVMGQKNPHLIIQ